jgi:hypothetical protein
MSNETRELVAAFDSGDDARIDAALDDHPHTERALARLYADAVGSGRALWKDAARYERLDDDTAGDAWAFANRAAPYDV